MLSSNLVFTLAWSGISVCSSLSILQRHWWQSVFSVRNELFFYYYYCNREHAIIIISIWSKVMWWKVLCCMLRSRPKMKMKKRKIMCTDILAAVLSVGKHFSIFILLVYELGVGRCETSPVCFLRVIWKWILGHSMSFFFMKWTISLGEYGKSINLLNMWTKSHQVFLSVSKGRRRGNDDAFFFLCERE